MRLCPGGYCPSIDSHPSCSGERRSRLRDKYAWWGSGSQSLSWVVSDEAEHARYVGLAGVSTPACRSSSAWAEVEMGSLSRPPGPRGQSSSM